MNNLIVSSIVSCIAFIVFIIIIIYFKNEKQNILVMQVNEINVDLEANIEGEIIKGYKVSSTLKIVRSTEYYILATLTSNQISQKETKIANLLDIIISHLNDKIKNQIKQRRQLWLTGNSQQEFLEFDVFKDSKTVEGVRNVSDLTAFGTNPPTPGFIRNSFGECDSNYVTEDIIFHEFMHGIHMALSDEEKNKINDLYIKYKIPNEQYNIDSYAFASVFEFLAEMAQVFTRTTKRIDVTGGITYDILKNNLPDMFSYLNDFFINNLDLITNLCNELYCPYCNDFVTKK